ncbi:MAG: hypothetical protein H7Y16_01740, partial [Candidatus Parcubacteria bacterium]|nr:hypothetical protein [Burkholderiales bacterium]
MRALNVAAFSALLALVGAARAAGDVSVEAIRREEGLEVTSRALLDAPLELIWQTLTDYGRLAEFIPGMRRSRVTGRRGAAVIVEQSGEARFLFMTYPIEVTL